MTKAKFWAIAEVTAVTALTMTAIWFFQERPLPFVATVTMLTAVILVSFATRIYITKKAIPNDLEPATRNALIAEKIGDYTQELGIGRWRRSFRRGWYVEFLDFSWAFRLACLTVLGLALILIAGYFFKPEFWLMRKFWSRVILGIPGYIVWGVLQQFALHAVATNRIYSIFAGDLNPGLCDKRAAGWTALISGILFFFAHIPNPTLMIVTPIAGAATAYIFLNCRNIFMLGIAHGVLGNTIGYCLANNLAIGPNYWS